MEPNKTIHIDSALNQLLGKHTFAEGSDYNDFLQRLAEHDKNKVLLDAVLEEKLTIPPVDSIGTWKRIVAIIWFRRIRNAAIALIIVFAAVSSFQYYKGLQAGRSVPALTKQVEIKSADNNAVPQKQTSYNKNSLDSTTKNPGSASVDKHQMFSVLTKGNNASTNSAEQAMDNSSVTKDFSEVLPETEDMAKLNIYGLQKTIAFAGILQEQLTVLPLLKLGALQHPKIPLFDRVPKTGVVLGFQLNSSFQSWHSSVQGNTETTNRNYADLAGNGRKNSLTLNYGFTLEKSIFKGFGLGLGVGKMTMRQQQTTDYLLTEAPVFDLDGHIAGYIAITPEKIQTKIDNRVDYIIFPVNLMYAFTLTPGSSIQLKAGSSLTTELKKQTEKFNYGSLNLEQYNSGGQSLSMNNIQYGMAFTRQLRGPVLLSLGYERQVFKQVNALSDHTEKVGATIHNFNISLKYKL